MSESSENVDGRYRGTDGFEAARNQLIDAARTEDGFVTYPEVAETADIRATGEAFVEAVSTLLGEISTDEHAAGRPLLSAIVKGEKKTEPGKGFAKLAKELGRRKDSDDKLVFWLKEVSALRAYWQDQPEAGFNNHNVPRCRDYITALATLEEKLNEKQRRTLEFQFMQPGRAMTSTELAEFHGDRTDVGKPGNLVYGRLASLFAHELEFDTWPESHNSHWYRAISTWNGTGWTMRPQLAEALIDCGMVDRELDGLLLEEHVAEFSTTEGRRVLVQHLVRERDSSLARRKRESAESFACEVCGFDAEAFYGVAYCEVHHKKVLGEAEGEQEISLDDLAIVCANCHRQIHRQYPALTVEELKSQVEQRRA
ncbi:MAG TPA: hypothetical protein DDW52_10830 [Planctomycetaceae bacterium]|nr:hypothetical protein [Planctomycetaceae bacterium]